MRRAGLTWDGDPRVKPPFGAAEVDWSGPLAWGLTGVWLFNEGGGTLIDLTGRHRAGALVGPPSRTLNARGRALNFTANGSQYVPAHPTTNVAGQLNLTILAVGRCPDATATYRPAIYCERAASGSNTILKLNRRDTPSPTTTLELVFRDEAGTLDRISANTVLTDAVLRTMGVTKAGTAITHYLDGVPDGTGTLTASDLIFGTGVPTTIGSDPADVALSTWAGDLNLVMTSARALSAADILRLHVEPYAMLRPRVSRRYFVPAAAGGMLPYTPLRRRQRRRLLT